MVNDDHLKILKKGADKWKSWRDKNPQIPDLKDLKLNGESLADMDLGDADLRGAEFVEVNLSGANLANADLRGAKFKDVNCTGTNCEGADFSGAELTNTSFNSLAFLSDSIFNLAQLTNVNFRESDLLGVTFKEAYLFKVDFGDAKLQEADFTRAYLRDVDFSGANLIEANFSEAYLENVEFKNANLRGANFFKTKFIDVNFSRAKLENTIFAFCDLSRIKSLGDVKHDAPSIIDINAILMSKGKIPNIFLRNAGVPQDLISKIQDLGRQSKPQTNQPCSLIYSKKDSDLAKILTDDLIKNGVIVNICSPTKKQGASTLENNLKAPLFQGKCIVICSEHSMKEEKTQKNIINALSKGNKDILLIELDDSFQKSLIDEERIMGTSGNRFNFRRWEERPEYEKSLKNLLKKLNK